MGQKDARCIKRIQNVAMKDAPLTEWNAVNSCSVADFASVNVLAQLLRKWHSFSAHAIWVHCLGEAGPFRVNFGEVL
jgi:hypothetical protein